MPTDPQDRMRALLREAPTRTLVTSLLTLDAMEPSPERNLTRGMTIGELEQRFPDASKAVQTAFDEAEARIAQGQPGEVDYVAVLVAAIPPEEL